MLSGLEKKPQLVSVAYFAVTEDSLLYSNDS